MVIHTQIKMKKITINGEELTEKETKRLKDLVEWGFDGMDFDTDIIDFSIAVSSIETISEIDITSNDLTITAVVESETAIISHATGLTEDNLNGAIVTMVLINVEFDDGTPSVDSSRADYGISYSEYPDDDERRSRPDYERCRGCQGLTKSSQGAPRKPHPSPIRNQRSRWD